MKTKLLLTLLAGIFAAGTAAADSTYTYTLDSSKATITGFVSGVTPSGSIAVPATVDGYTVTGVGRSAFKDRTAITAVSFAGGANVTRIGATAFQGCTSLQTAVLPSGLTAAPAGLFQGCTALTSVTIPTAVTSIGGVAFADCRSLASLTLPSGLISVGEGAFSNCRSLTALSFPAGVTVLPGQVCSDCRSLTSLTVAGAVTSVGDSAFANCTGLASITLPDATVSIGKSAFEGCSSLASFTLGAGLTTIGSRALEGCPALGVIVAPSGNASFSSTGGVLFDKNKTTVVKYPPALSGSYAVPASVTALAEGAFAHATSLTSLTLSSGVASIATDAFYYASGITSLTIPSGVTTIGQWAFAGLKSLTGVTLPASVTSVGVDAFHYDSALQWALFNGNAPTMGRTVFDSATSGFTVYFRSTATGFTTPTWLGYASASLDLPSALITWLGSHNLSPASDLSADANADGVNLLLAYALGLDPANNLSGLLPQPVLSGGALSLSFQGNAEGIAYSAETSTDLVSWTATGVTLTSADATTGQRTASVAQEEGAPVRFLRLVVGY